VACQCGISIYFAIDNDKVVITYFRFIKDLSKMKIQNPNDNIKLSTLKQGTKTTNHHQTSSDKVLQWLKP
jgi:hypothetical protein